MRSAASAVVLYSAIHRYPSPLLTGLDDLPDVREREYAVAQNRVPSSWRDGPPTGNGPGSRLGLTAATAPAQTTAVVPLCSSNGRCSQVPPRWTFMLIWR